MQLSYVDMLDKYVVMQPIYFNMQLTCRYICGNLYTFLSFVSFLTYNVLFRSSMPIFSSKKKTSHQKTIFIFLECSLQIK